jgi:hypothetical protein
MSYKKLEKKYKQMVQTNAKQEKDQLKRALENSNKEKEMYKNNWEKMNKDNLRLRKSMQELVNQNNMLKRQVTILEQQEDVSNDQKADSIKEQLDYEVEKLKKELYSETEKGKKWEIYCNELKIEKQKAENEKNSIMNELNQLRRQVKDLMDRNGKLEREKKVAESNWRATNEELSNLKNPKNFQKNELVLTQEQKPEHLFSEPFEKNHYHDKKLEDYSNHPEDYFNQKEEINQDNEEDTQEQEYYENDRNEQEEQLEDPLYDKQVEEPSSHHQPQNPKQANPHQNQAIRVISETQKDQNPPAKSNHKVKVAPASLFSTSQPSAQIFPTTHAPAPIPAPGNTRNTPLEAEEFFSSFSQPMQTPQQPKGTFHFPQELHSQPGESPHFSQLQNEKQQFSQAKPHPTPQNMLK